MKVQNYSEVDARNFPGIDGVNIRWMVGKKDDAPNCAMRVIEVDPGRNTPFHQHDYEHEVFIIDGSGYLKDENDNQHAFQKGTVIYVKPNEWHGFFNNADKTLRFICVVPHIDGLEPLDEAQEAVVC